MCSDFLWCINPAPQGYDRALVILVQACIDSGNRRGASEMPAGCLFHWECTGPGGHFACDWQGGCCCRNPEGRSPIDSYHREFFNEYKIAKYCENYESLIDQNKTSKPIFDDFKLTTLFSTCTNSTFAL